MSEAIEQKQGHIPVMAREVEEILRPKPGMVLVDGTLGLGGHALRLGTLVGEAGRIVGIDQDDNAISRAAERLKGVAGRVDIVKNNFRKIAGVLDSLGIRTVDGVLLDLGVSSLQLDDAARGFSFRHNGPLDMRMDPRAPVSAFELINTSSESELARIIGEYGEERFSRRIANAIVKARAARQITTTGELSEVVLTAMPYRQGKEAIHPATRTFQGIRIAVNHELEALQEALGAAFERLSPGGRLAVIAFHSLEDRIVKETFRALARSGRAVLLTKKPLRPASEEEAANPRSRSARLRGLERVA